MAKDAIGYALTALNRLASSELLDRLGMRHTAERLAYRLTKGGFQVLTTSARAFKSARKVDRPERLNAPGTTTDLFDLNITEEQQMIRDSVRAFAGEVLREQAEQADHDQGTAEEVMGQARELGLNFFAVPEALGGAANESTTVTSMLVAEDLGWGDMGQAVAILAPMGVANALTRWGTATQQDKYLGSFAEEQAPLATIAVTEPRPLFDPMVLNTHATRDGDDWVITGEKSLVPLAAEAELFLVAAATEEGPAVFIVEGGTEGLTVGEDPAMGIRASAQRPLRLDEVRVPEQNRLGDEDFDYRAFVDLGTLAWCALAIGTAQAVLDYVVPYCNERTAFGEPISHRQAVAFMIADMAIELDAMRMLTYRAACRAEQGKSFRREAHLARTLVKDKAMKIGTDGVQLLGGHGFTKEYPVERWYRDLRAVGVAFGGLHL
ncbi:alkylation response protein AidB-like acyl-CoA dehydrogenase [Alloalcanivorax xenomutans]|uniref:acyl-CoA dehydrogenase family protein n=1 Tax=Alloalcanivorax xenomutans TaxID=1094342 RepID=UPI000BC8CB2E|nr:acyl-CoA dehydrogenase family protein [Alloalcanivorax xenomutans]SOC04370.1 alkylation response protein AidB-like acyl-CoA dehydrogenase [Alloalcanivorax xenomutans]